MRPVNKYKNFETDYNKNKWKLKMNHYGKTIWRWGDIFYLKPEWTKEQCEDFLARYSDELSDVQDKEGWHYMLHILFEKEEKAEL